MAGGCIWHSRCNQGSGTLLSESITTASGYEGNESAGWAGPRSVLQSLSRPSILIASLLVVLGVGSEVWQPFSLGFFHDDWYLFVRLHDLRAVFDLTPDRPGYHWLSWIILHIWDGSPAAFQWIKVVINLATAASIFWLTLSIQRLFGASSPVLAAGAATLWLIAPWGLGYTVWATAAFTNVSLLCFCISMVQFLRFVQRGSWVGLTLAIVLWTISIATYQSTWFAFIPVAFATLLAIYDQAPLRRRLLVLASVLLTIQFAGLVQTALTTPKTRNPDLVGMLGTNLRNIWLIHVRFLGAWICGLMLILVTGQGIAARFDSRNNYLNARRIAAGTTMLIVGSIGSAALYASAGYLFGGEGETSKTSAMFTFWVAMGFSVALAADARDTRKTLIGIAASLVVTAMALFDYPAMTRPWIASWKLQREVLQTIKGQSFPQRLQFGDVILSDVPLYVDRAAVFGAPWSITPAALSVWADAIPDLARQGLSPVMIIPAFAPNMSWENGTLTMTPNWTMPAKRLWVWRWKTGDAALVQTPGPLPPPPFDGLLDGPHAQ